MTYKIWFFNITPVASQKISSKSQVTSSVWCVVFFSTKKKADGVCSRVLVEGNLQDSPLVGGTWIVGIVGWFFFPRHLKNMRSQIGSFPQVGMKITNIWNHQLFTSWWVCSHPFEKYAEPSNGIITPRDPTFVSSTLNVEVSEVRTFGMTKKKRFFS